jgi:hypothetical protein
MKNSQTTGPDTGGNEAMWQRVEQDKRMAKKTGVVCSWIRSSGGWLHAALTQGYARAISRHVHDLASQERLGLWGSLRHRTQASFSVALPVTDVVTLAQLDADP